jgi:hypothetical protein
MAVPTDPAFYQGVIAMAQRLGSKPEDLLWVWASETAFNPNPDPSGNSRTISTLMHAVVDQGLLTQAEWDSLPTLTPAQQLPYIERYYKLLRDKYIGRNFRDTFETYLANAAPGLLRPDGQYNAQTTMYGDPNAPAHTSAWSFNWPMDNYPAAATAAAARGISGKAFNKSFAEQLVSEGLLKGWITLGDLKNFMLRPGVSSIANAAIAQLKTAQTGGVTPAGYSPSAEEPYSPSFGQSFGNPNAPVDTRIAPAFPTPRPALSILELSLVAAVAYFGLRWLKS